ncbi:hypothetical protein U8527_04415 [Kordia algicida OT-1]|uniref:hypothetical protein n=1 Tax=Kordia algicida TaxID=221066 RepID=UPI0012F79167|nr:hypothetical protein [Kordia algicida]
MEAEAAVAAVSAAVADLVAASAAADSVVVVLEEVGSFDKLNYLVVTSKIDCQKFFISTPLNVKTFEKMFQFQSTSRYNFSSFHSKKPLEETFLVI